MSRPPNIVWINTDQHPHANRPGGANIRPLQTHLGARGTTFTQAYSPLPICSPARASLLTGLYPVAHGLTENDGRFGGRPELDAKDWMFTDALRDAGYRCAWFGKWHLSQTKTAQDFGFEGWSLPGYGYPYSSDAYADYLADRALPNPLVRIEQSGECGTIHGQELDLSDLSDWPEYEAGTGEMLAPIACHEAAFVSYFAKEWVRTAEPDTPFLLRLDPWGPHPPYYVPKPFHDALRGGPDPRPANFFHDLSGRPDHHSDYRDSWAFLEHDAQDWRALAQRALEHAMMIETALLTFVKWFEASPLAHDTVIVMTSDHGDAVGSNGGLANKGSLMTEDTILVPMVLAGSGFEAGAQHVEPVSTLDLVPTLLRIAGCDVPGQVQGRALGQRSGGVMIEHYGLHVPLSQRAWREGDWKLVEQEDGFTELYNLVDDPGEMRNLCNSPDAADTLSDMKAALFAERSRLGI